MVIMVFYSEISLQSGNYVPDTHIPGQGLLYVPFVYSTAGYLIDQVSYHTGDIMEISENRLKELISPFKCARGATIPVLQSIQNEYGYIPPEAFDLIEEEIGIPASRSYGVATFYAQFRLEPIGKHIIKVCNGTACHVKGSETILTALRDYLKLGEEDTTDDNLFTMEEVACLGCCSLAPVMMIDETTYGSLTIEKVRGIIDDYRKGGGSDE